MEYGCLQICYISCVWENISILSLLVVVFSSTRQLYLNSILFFISFSLSCSPSLSQTHTHTHNFFLERLFVEVFLMHTHFFVRLFSQFLQLEYTHAVYTGWVCRLSSNLYRNKQIKQQQNLPQTNNEKRSPTTTGLRTGSLYYCENYIRKEYNLGSTFIYLNGLVFGRGIEKGSITNRECYLRRELHTAQNIACIILISTYGTLWDTHTPL